MSVVADSVDAQYRTRDIDGRAKAANHTTSNRATSNRAASNRATSNRATSKRAITMAHVRRDVGPRNLDTYDLDGPRAARRRPAQP